MSAVSDNEEFLCIFECLKSTVPVLQGTQTVEKAKPQRKPNNFE